MKKLELNQMENLEGGRRFWGWEAGPNSPCINGYYWADETYYVLGVAVDTIRDVRQDPC